MGTGVLREAMLTGQYCSEGIRKDPLVLPYLSPCPYSYGFHASLPPPYKATNSAFSNRSQIRFLWMKLPQDRGWPVSPRFIALCDFLFPGPVLCAL